MNAESIKITLEKLWLSPSAAPNRGEDGNPKTARIGGVERARVSSQCQKRTIREALRMVAKELGIEDMINVVRTHALAPELNRILVERGMSLDDAAKLARIGFSAMGCKAKARAKTKDDNLVPLSSALYALTKKEIATIADVLEKNASAYMSEFDAATEKAVKESVEAAKKKAKKSGKKFDEEVVMEKARKNIKCPVKIANAIKKSVSGLEHSAECRFMGRMLASLEGMGVDSRILLPSAFGIECYAPEEDFFVAMDDLHDQTGVDGKRMVPTAVQNMGTRILTSNIFYHVLVIEVGEVAMEIGVEKAAKFAEALLDTFVTARIRGGRSYSGNNNMPSYVRVTAGIHDYNNAEAFAVPLQATYPEDNLIKMGVEKLEKNAEMFTAKYHQVPKFKAQMYVAEDRDVEGECKNFNEMKERLRKFLSTLTVSKGEKK